MYIGKLTAVLALTTGLGAASALAESAMIPSGASDMTGQTSLGIDISRAGASPETVQTFLAELSPEALRGVLGGCQNAINSPSSYAPNVIAFCQSAVGSAPSGQVFGFAAEPEPMLSPDVPATQQPSSGATNY